MIKPAYNPIYKKDGYMLTEDLPYKANGAFRYVPRFFFVDGASIPPFFWQLLSSPYDPRILEDAIIHDWEYTVKYQPRSLCDRGLYERMLKRGKYNRAQIEAVYRGLQIGGWIGWGDTLQDIEYFETFKIDMVARGLPWGRYGII